MGIAHVYHSRFQKITRRVRWCLGIVFAVIVLASPLGDVPAYAVETQRGCDPHNYGATGQGVALDSPAINAAIAACSANGGGKVHLSPGIYRSGTIRFQNDVTLDLDAGAVILGSSNLADYAHMSRTSEWRDTPLIVAENVHNIAITGEGVIDGNGRAFIDPAGPHWRPSFDVMLTRQGQAWADLMAQSNEGPVAMLPRPGVLFVALHVDGLKLHAVHIVDSPNWTVKIGCSKHIEVSHLTVRNDLLIPNNDALEISASQYATVSDSYLEAGDDALVIGGPCLDGWCQEPAKHIKVHNVTLVSRSAAIRVGPSARGAQDLKFSRVLIKDSNRGVLIQARADEIAEDISFEHMVINTRLINGPWWGGGEPIAISLSHGDYVSWAHTSQLGILRNIRFKDVVANSQSPIVIYGSEPGRIQNISFQKTSLTLAAGPLTAALGGNIDLQPSTPEVGVRKQDLPAILVHNADEVSFNHLTVTWQGTFPEGYYTNALAVDGFGGLAINGFQGASADGTLPAIKLENGSDADIKNAKAKAGQLLSETNVTKTADQ